VAGEFGAESKGGRSRSGPNEAFIRENTLAEIETIIEAGPYGPPSETDETRMKDYRYRTMGDGRRVRDADMLEFVRTNRVGRECHSDGFLSVSGMVEPAYECECGFRGLFVSETCARCQKTLRREPKG
jgi:hypothetical protein